VTPPAARGGRLLPLGGLLLAMVSIQAGAALAKDLFPRVGPAGAATLRLVFAAVLLTVAFRAWRGLGTRLRSRSLLALGAALGLMNLLFYASLQRIPLGVAVAIEFLGPLGLSLAASRRGTDLLWAGLAASGVGLLVWPRSHAVAALDVYGLLLAAAAGACWAAYIVFGTRTSNAHGGSAIAVAMMLAMAVVLPFGISSAGSRLLDVALLPVAVAVALLSSALPYTIELFAMARLPTRTFSIFMSLEPAVAVVSGWLLLGERLDGLQLLGIGCVTFASAGATTAVEPRDLG
jgi:inner membrane transporter RhtA